MFHILPNSPFVNHPFSSFVIPTNSQYRKVTSNLLSTTYNKPQRNSHKKKYAVGIAKF